MAHCSLEDVKRDALARAMSIFKKNANSISLNRDTATISYGSKFQVKTYEQALEMAGKKLKEVEDWAAKSFGEKFRTGWGTIGRLPDKLQVKFLVPKNLVEAYTIKKSEFSRDIDYFGGDEQLMQQEMYQLNKDFPTKKGVDYVFEQNSGLNKIGTQQQYSQYLNTIFPDSKVKDIVYHGGSKKIEEVGKFYKPGSESYKKNDSMTKEGIYFAFNLREAIGYTKKFIFKDSNKKVYPVVVNSNPYDNVKQVEKRDKTRKEIDLVSIEPIDKEWLLNQGYNSLTNKGRIQDVDSPFLVVFEPEQIHILGSKEDIEGFKEFVSSTESQTQPKKTSDEEVNNKIKSWLEKVGITYKSVDKIYDLNGNEINATAKADMLNGIVEVVEGKRGLDTLPEEAAHFIVELLGDNHPFVRGMMSRIANYNVYKEVVNSPYGEIYKNDEIALKKEAIGKLIAKIITGQEIEETTQRQEFSNNWFKALWNWLSSRLKRLVGTPARDELYEFKQAAEMILSGDTRGLKKIDEVAEKKIFYQIDESAQDKIISRIKSANVVYDQTTGKYYKDGKEIAHRVSDLVKALERKRFRRKVETEQSDKSKRLAKGGTVTHKYLQLLMEDKIAGTESSYIQIRDKVRNDLRNHPDISKELDSLTEISMRDFIELRNGISKLYEKINNYQETINKETSTKGKAQILTEQIIYNPSTDTAGTIDVLVVYSNGKGSIYDFKGQNFFTKNKEVIGEVPLSKIQSTDTQILNYISIVRTNYGISDFVETRLLPVNLQVNDTSGKISKLEFGSRSAKGDYREYLEEIPVAKELTGIKDIDVQLDKMFRLKENLEKQYAKEYYNKSLREKIDRINKSIKKLQIDQDTRYVYVEITNLIKDFESRKTRPDGIDIDYLNDLIDYLTVYKDFFRTAKRLEVVDKTSEKIREIEYEYDRINSKILDVIEEAELKGKDIISKEFSDIDLNKPTKELGVLGSMFKRFSQFDRPQFKVFSNLILKRASYVREKVDEISKDLTKKKDALNEWAKSRGKDLNWAIEQLIDPKTGNLKSKYSTTYREEYREAVKNKNLKWFAENTNVTFKDGKFVYKEESDSKKFQEYKEEAKKIIEANYPGVENEELRKKKMANWIATHDITEDPNAILKTPYLIRPSEDSRFYSELWNMMNRSENKPLLDVYNTIINYNREFAEVTGKDIKVGFIPEIQKGIFDTASNWGIGMEAIAENTRKAFTTREYDVLQGSRDAVTGEIIPSIPLLFTDELTIGLTPKEITEIEQSLKDLGLTEGSIDWNKAYDSAVSKKEREKGVLLKSKDIFKSTLLFAESVYTYSYTKDIESTVKTLRRSLETAQTEITDTSGKKVVDKFTGIVAKAVGMPKGELEAFDKYMNLYIYGRKIQNKDFTTESGISSNKTIQQIMRGTSLKALGLSWIAGFGNAIGTSQNLMFLASEGKYFTKEQIGKSLKMLLGKDKGNANILLNYFSPYAHNLTYTKANNLSVSWATKNISEDLFYILMKTPDTAVDMIAGLSILQNFGIDENGNIRNVSRTGGKSILDTLTVKDDKVTGITEQQYHQLRQLMLDAGNKIKGSMSQEDMNLIGTNIYTAMFMQFRNWMPGLISNRFSQLTYDEKTDSLDVGRFRILFGEFTAKGILPKLEAFSKLLLEVGSFGKYNRYNNPSDLAIANKYFEKFLDQNQELRGKITIDDFIELRKQKLQGMAAELRTLLGLYLLVMLAGAAQPDDDTDPVSKFIAQNAYRMTNRGMLEISFFFDPQSVTQILKQPLPIFRNLTDLQKMMYNTIDEGRDMAFGDYKGAFIWTPDKKDKTPPLYYTSKFIPGNRALTDIFDFFDNFDNYIKK